MMRRRLFLAAATLALCLLCACAREPLVKSDILLDTFVTITIYEGGNQKTLDGAFALCQRYDVLFNRKNPASEVAKLNDAGGAAVEVSADVRVVLERGLYYAALSEGAYDVTIAPVSDLWDFKSADPTVPDAAALAGAAQLVDYHSIVIEGDAVRLLNGAQIDLGSIAKGYIADKIGEYLRGDGVKSAIVNLGGNVLAVGEKPGGKQFRIGIQKPFGESGETVGAVAFSNGSMVSSGVYERCFFKDGKLYHHILDAGTGMPADNGLWSVTILSPESIDGDALSTCCFVLGLTDGMALVESLEGIEAVFVDDKGELHFSSGFAYKYTFAAA